MVCVNNFLRRKVLLSGTENYLKNLILRNTNITRLIYAIILKWREYSRSIKTMERKFNKNVYKNKNQSRIEPIFFNTEGAYFS